MLISLKRKRIASEREAAVKHRETAARDFVAALREAEAALQAMKEANDKFYASDLPSVQASLANLRRDRERMFMFHAAKEVVSEAPRLAKLLGARVAPTAAMPLVEWIQHTSNLDLGVAGDVKPKEA